MQIVINIDEEVYKRTLPYKDLPIISNLANDYDEITHAVANGVLLPKGHGRLGDLSKIYDRLNDAQIEKTVEYKGLGEAKQIICDAPTIIEADKEVEDGNDD